MIYAEVKSGGVINQVWKGVEDTNFSPPILDGSELLSWPDGTDIRPGMIWDGSRLLPPPPPPIDQVREVAFIKLADTSKEVRAEIAGTGRF